MRSHKPLSRNLAVVLLGLSTFFLLPLVLAQINRPVSSRLDSFQFKSLCEMQKRMPTGQRLDCHCAAYVYERIVQRQLDRYDEMIKYYEEKMSSEPSKVETYARAAERQRQERKQYLEDSLRVDTEVFRDLIRRAQLECPER